jgi:hypothetical protein
LHHQSVHWQCMITMEKTKLLHLTCQFWVIYIILGYISRCLLSPLTHFCPQDEAACSSKIWKRHCKNPKRESTLTWKLKISYCIKWYYINTLAYLIVNHIYCMNRLHTPSHTQFQHILCKMKNKNISNPTQHFCIMSQEC